MMKFIMPFLYFCAPKQYNVDIYEDNEGLKKSINFYYIETFPLFLLLCFAKKNNNHLCASMAP